MRYRNRQVPTARYLPVAVCLLSLLLGMELGPGPIIQTHARTLEAGIRHVEVMPSISTDLRPGAFYSGNITHEKTPANVWIQIPDWMAGTWSINEETAVYRHDYRSGKTYDQPLKFKARQKFIYGMQKDRLGGIWHYAGTPYTSRTRMSGFDEIHIVNDKIFDQDEDKTPREHVGFKSTVTVLRIEPGSSKIRESYQQESITRYEPVDKGTGIIKLFGSTKSFDQDGKPRVQTDNQAYVRKTSPYSRIDRHKGLDMHGLFKQFLIDSNRANLLPD